MLSIASAQKLTVESMKAAPYDISASQYERKDLNQQPCALVKVQLAGIGAEFEGNVIGKSEYKTGEYWVYMSEQSYMLTVKHPNFVPLAVNFRDYGIKGVEQKVTYVLTLNIPQAGAQPLDDGMRYLLMSVEPANATVYVNDQLQQVQNGTLTMLLPMGEYSYRVEAPAYETQSGTFTVGNEKVTLPIKLKSTMATLSVSTGTTGTQIFINDQQRGTSSWQGTLPPGTYRVEGRLAGHRTHRQNVTLASRDQQQVTIPALVAITGMLNVNVQPMNAEVWLDGSRLGTSPDIFRNITVGSHSVELRAAGYTTKTESVTIEEGQTAMLTTSLIRIPSEDAEIEGKTPAQIVSLGYDYDVGRNGKTKDLMKAVKYYRIAAERGDAWGQNNLGIMYRDGKGVTRDYAEAVKWFRKAVEQGHASGQISLGYMYETGRGVPQDDTEAVKWYRKAAEQGHANGQLNLGWQYEKGYGVTQDYIEAVKWYRKAAEQGHANGQAGLGRMYETGRGVPQDDTEAVKWYRKAAEQGNATGQNNLGVMYRDGRGVTQDHAEAVKWFRKAAEQGHAMGQNNLGCMYVNGRGVTKDLKQAKYWYEKSAAQGNEKAKQNLMELNQRH